MQGDPLGGTYSLNIIININSSRRTSRLIIIITFKSSKQLRHAAMCTVIGKYLPAVRLSRLV